MLNVSCNANNQEKGMDIASLYHFFGRVVQLRIDCDPLLKALFRGIVVLENKFPNISSGGGNKIPQDLFEFVIFSYLLH